MTITYEWTVEETDEHGDIIDTAAWDTARDAYAHLARRDGELSLCLVRHVHDDAGNLVDRQWAYLDGGELPEKFDGGARVPKRYREELAAAWGAAQQPEAPRELTYHVCSIGAVPVTSLPEKLAKLLPIGYMDAAFALDVSYRQVYGAALNLIRHGRARWRGKTLVPVKGESA